MINPPQPKRAATPLPSSAGGALVDGKEQCCQITSKQTEFDAWGFEIKPAKEFSRQRLRRRRQIAARILRNEAPRGDGHRDQKRGRWYPVSACGSVPAAGEMALHVRASGRIDRFGIMRCGSVWTCPECAQRIATHRGTEIKAVIEAARERGCRVEMVTFTLPHDLTLSFQTCFQRLKDALRATSSNGTAVRILRSLNFIGQVRSIEVTWGWTSGWHVHAQAVMVFEADGDSSQAADEDFARSLEFKKMLYPVWKRSAHRAGANTPSFKHGLDVRAVWSANDYLAKLPEAAKAKDEAGKPRWGADAELSKAYMKEGRKSSLTPWEMLDQADTNAHFATLIKEYAAGTWARSQIEWSKGARNLRAIFLSSADGLSDEDAAVAEPEWVFADEDLPDVGQANLVIEKVLIWASDAWRARVYRFGSLDRACADVERGDALSLADRLRADGWRVEQKSELRYGSELRADEAGIMRRHTTIEAAQFVAYWPGRDAK